RRSCRRNFANQACGQKTDPGDLRILMLRHYRAPKDAGGSGHVGRALKPCLVRENVVHYAAATGRRLKIKIIPRSELVGFAIDLNLDPMNWSRTRAEHQL